MLKYLNSNRLSVALLFFIFPVAYWIAGMFTGSIREAAIHAEAVPLGQLVVAFDLHARVFASLLAIALILLNGYLLIQLNTIHIFIPYRTYLPLFFYALLTIGVTRINHLTPALVASSLLILAFFRIFHTYKSEKISLNFIDAGLLTGLAGLFYFHSIFFFVFLLVALLIIRPFIWREWAFACIGFLLPYLFVFSIYYLLDIPLSDFFSGLSEVFQRMPVDLNLSEIVNWSYILFFIVVSSFILVNAIDSMKIHARKFFIAFLAFFLCSVMIFFIVPGTGLQMIYFTGVPLSYLFSYYFVRANRNWANEFFITAFIILLIWLRLAAFI